MSRDRPSPGIFRISLTRALSIS